MPRREARASAIEMQISYIKPIRSITANASAEIHEVLYTGRSRRPQRPLTPIFRPGRWITIIVVLKGRNRRHVIEIAVPLLIRLDRHGIIVVVWSRIPNRQAQMRRNGISDRRRPTHTMHILLSGRAATMQGDGNGKAELRLRALEARARGDLARRAGGGVVVAARSLGGVEERQARQSGGRGCGCNFWRCGRGRSHELGGRYGGVLAGCDIVRGEFVALATAAAKEEPEQRDHD